MDRSEQIRALNEALLKEMPGCRAQAAQFPHGEIQQRRLLRGLMNVRPPMPLDPRFLELQDALLAAEREEKGVVDGGALPVIAADPRLAVWQGDITRLHVGAIVNAANSQMLGCFVPCHGCIDNAIHSAAGIELREACSHYMTRKRMQYGRRYEEPTGQAVLTEGYNLPAEYVIHTVGPIVGGYLNQGLRDDLRNCYQNVLKCCVEHKIRSVAFCCISTGEFHFPNDEAAKIAVETVTKILNEHSAEFDRVVFNVFKDVDRELYEEELS